VFVDPEAAKVVYNSGVPVVQVGLDVCDMVTQTEKNLKEIESAGTRAGKFLVRLLEFRKTAAHPVYDEKGNVVKMVKASEQRASLREGMGLNDLTTTGYLINPGWFKTMSAAMDVETKGSLTDGETVIDYRGLWGRPPNGYFAYEVDGQALVEQWVKDMKAFNS
jgi:inosine-uridine nucleoside N-ribohydrolase